MKIQVAAATILVDANQGNQALSPLETRATLGACGGVNMRPAWAGVMPVSTA